MTEVVIGAEWAARYPERFRGDNPRYDSVGDRPPCFVCGHPTGDCAPHNLEPPMTEPRKATAAKKAAAPARTDLPTKGSDTTAAAKDTVVADSTGDVSKAAESDLTPIAPDGAVNAHNELAGGNHEASQRLDAIVDASAKKKAGTTGKNVPHGFTAVSDEVLCADEDIVVHFTPANVVVESTVLAFHKGQLVTRQGVADRFALYEGASGYRVG